MDHDKILALLHIFEKAHANSPSLGNIRDSAWKELIQINTDLNPKILAPVDYTPTPLDKAVPAESEPPPAAADNGETPGIRRI